MSESHFPDSDPSNDSGSEQSRHVMVVGPDGTPMGAAHVNGGEEGDQDGPLGDMVEEPAKVMRIGTMIKQLLEEVRTAPLDDASRDRLREIHATSITELEQALTPDMQSELERLVAPLTEDRTPSDAELRVAQAQLVGWLEGLFHGIQTALFAQQMAARAQLEQMQRGLPPGAGSAQGAGERQAQSGGGIASPGQYL